MRPVTRPSSTRTWRKCKSPVADRTRLGRRQRPRLLEQRRARAAARARALRVRRACRAIIGTRSSMSARFVQFSGRRSPSRGHHLGAVQRPEKARELDGERLEGGRRRVAELDSGQETRPEEGPRKGVRRSADVLRHRDRKRQQSPRARAAARSRAGTPAARPRAAETGTPTRRRRRRRCCPSPRRASAPAAPRARETAPRRAAARASYPPRSRDPTAARDADYVSRLQAWLAAEIPRGS